ncbi:CHAT domain-containing protein [Streptomyces sp. NPDC051217]|uniref:CHAT domain-containing protein n=1 Tax=Streptomyces sp. NPDC051217 TaxID=3365644 RepID=UPI0037A5A193
MNSLGVAFFDRYRLNGAAYDLNDALRHLVAAYEKAEPGTVQRARVLFNLSSALTAHLSVASRRLPRDLRERLPSSRALREEMSDEPGIPVIERLRAACESGYSAVAESGPAAGYPYLAQAVGLLPRAVWGAREQVLDFLGGHRGLASDAAALAIAADRPEHAVQLLEHGRAVMWEQQLSTRTRQQEMRESASQEANRLRRQLDRVYAGLSELAPLADRDHANVQEADRGGDSGDDLRMDTNRWGRPWPREGLGTELGDWSIAQLESEWVRLSTRAQAILPATPFTALGYADLRRAAEGGYVVYVNVSLWGCDALIVTVDQEQPSRIPLPRLRAADAEERAKRYLVAMTGNQDDQQEIIRDTLDWLWHAVVAPVMSEVASSPNAGPTRTWWVPTGPLTTLPLHAAAPRDASDGSSALDLTVSSYTSTMSALIRARRAHEDLPSPDRRNRRSHLLVAPDTTYLPGAGRFHALLCELIPWWYRTTLSDAEATHARVSEALLKNPWTQFDCHAVQDLGEPLKSHLVLHDQPLTVSDLADLPFSQAEFALLAACTTAVGGDLVRDEWISLAAALMYSGFQSVIGTLWPVPDGPTARIAESVYEHLMRKRRGGPVWQFFRRPTLDHARSAEALRLAVLKERRNRPDHPSAWASFVHYGV